MMVVVGRGPSEHTARRREEGGAERVRLGELIRAWLETLSRSDDPGVAAMASCARELHDLLTSRRSDPQRTVMATRYITLVETLMPLDYRPALRATERARATTSVGASSSPRTSIASGPKRFKH
jgi:hypothetical protein